MATTTVIKASSRISTKINDTFYTVEYGEERSVEPGEDIEKARTELWDTCNNEVDSQIADIYNMTKTR